MIQNIDIRKEYSLLQQELGNDILFIRASKYIKCSCYNPLHKTGEPNCSVCMGRGFASVIEQKKVIAIQPDRVYNQKFVETGLGLMESVEMVYIFPYDSAPKAGDIIAKPYFNRNGVVTGINEIYTITGARAITGDNSRVELFNVKCKTDFAVSKALTKVVNEMTVEDRLKLKRGRRYICPVMKLKI